MRRIIQSVIFLLFTATLSRPLGAAPLNYTPTLGTGACYSVGAGGWIPIHAAAGAALSFTPTMVGLAGLNGTSYYAVTCDSSGNLTPGGAAGGDLGGTYPNPTVLSLADVNNGAIPVAITPPSVTTSALTVNGSPGTVTLPTASVAKAAIAGQAGSGAAITTGPTSSTSGDLMSFTGTAGQAADSGIAVSNVPLLNAANTFTATNTFNNATYSALFTGGNVGIGTTTPSGALLTVNGTMSLGSGVGTTGCSGTGCFLWGHAGTNNNLSIFGPFTQSNGITFQSMNDAQGALESMEFRAATYVFNQGNVQIGNGSITLYLCSGGTFSGLFASSSGACTGGSGTATRLSIQ